MAMVFQGMRIFQMFSLMAGMTPLALAAEFAKPAEGPVAFRRDRIPLEADAMGLLSRQIVLLTRSLDAKTPEELRAAAQMLALALALEPGNTDARRMVEDFEKHRHHPNIPVQDLERARSRIWQYIAWLETPEAGEHGQSLAACLKDVIVIADPKHPKSAALREAGEQGAWTGWVPEIVSFENPGTTPGTTPGTDPIDDTPGGDPVGDPVDEPAAPTRPKFQLAEAGIETVIWQKTGEEDSAEWVLAKVPLRMTARISESQIEPDNHGENGENSSERKKLSIRIGPDVAEGGYIRTSRNLAILLASRHENLPRGGHIHISSQEFENSLMPKRRQSISAAAAVLADSALTGVEPTGVVLGEIDETGAYQLSPGFWNQLQALRGGRGQRLIVPAAAAQLLPSMLAMENPGFFMENEVLIAADFKQLVELTAKKPAEAFAGSLTKFREIREKAESQDIRLYLGNKFVRDRLAAVLQEAPYHMSAGMLFTQAAGNRPTLVARSVLAAELRQAIAPVSKIALVNEFIPNPAVLENAGEIREVCREKVDGLLRYADKADRELVEQSQKMLDLVRDLDRASRTRGEDYVIAAAVMSAHRKLGSAFKNLNDSLAEESGEVIRAPSQ